MTHNQTIGRFRQTVPAAHPDEARMVQDPHPGEIPAIQKKAQRVLFRKAREKPIYIGMVNPLLSVPSQFILTNLGY